MKKSRKGGAAVNVGFELLGLWTSPGLLLRLLMVIDSPWEPLREGFVHRDTGEKARLAMGPPMPDLVDATLRGVDPVAPSIDAAIAHDMAEHKAVVLVTAAEGATDPLATALTVLRATDAIVNAGALCTRCRTSGRAEGADGFQLRVKAADQATGREALVDALLNAYTRFDLDRGCTIGNHALGAADIVLATVPESADRALAVLESAARAAVLAGTRSDTPDDRNLPRPLANPYGILRI